MAEGEQEVYVRSARTKVGASGRAKERRAGCGPDIVKSTRHAHPRLYVRPSMRECSASYNL